MKFDTHMDRMSDGGPIYHETDLSHFIAEPWNAFSSLVIALPAIYFLWKLKGNYKLYSFVIYFCAPLLIAGGIGSTLFHAFRAHTFFLVLDIAPIAVLTMGLSVWFIYRLIPKWYYVAAIVVFLFLLRGIIFTYFEGSDAINIMYFYTGSLIFVPGLLFVRKTNYCCLNLLLLSTLMFGISLFFRFYDDFPEQFMHMGTHWLWHVFSGIGALFLGLYLVGVQKTIKKIDLK
ncbi:MAG: hypothetical protein JXR58_04570 [Bacteroidales bacterium]|nr:hypothetical protein [Bacteroidales bacterium]